MLLSASFYESSLFGLVAGSVFTLGVTWWFWRRRTILYYGMPVAVPIINAPDDVRSQIVLSVDDKVREHPHRVEVQLICSRGPHDIASSDFDKERPIILNVGANIITMIGQPQVEPWDAEVPEVRYAGKMLTVPECLIRRGQRISVSLLVDGTPKLTRQQIVVKDVTPKRFVGEGPRLGLLAQAGIVAVGVALLCLMLFIAVEAVTPLDETTWWREIVTPALGALWLFAIFLGVANSVSGGIRRVHSWYRRRPRNH
ncbi:hypothetical protein [Streptomyces wuyuanensis]|uniref:hypothetical protein n=1 Tax=Streptomyces wuyuanensis TaxID=1196353 RepID=UPI0037173A2B